MATPDDRPVRGANAEFLVGLARAGAGAIIFSLPILMTLEMWELGVSIPSWRLALLTATTIPLLVALSYYVGFEDTSTLTDDVLDACAAYGVAVCTSAAVLYLFNVLQTGAPPRGMIGQVALQAVPASIGALLAQSQLGAGIKRQERTREPGYPGNLFFMGVGALFLSLNVAPTEEVQLLAYKMDDRHTLALAVVSLLIMHAFVYGVEFSGSPPEPPDTPWWSLFARYTVVGYAIALLIGLYVLWIFGRSDPLDVQQALNAGVVLAFPAAVGAAAARLIL